MRFSESLKLAFFSISHKKDNFSRDKAVFVVTKILPPMFNVIVSNIDESKKIIVLFLLSEERNPVLRFCRVVLEWLKDVLDSN